MGTDEEVCAAALLALTDLLRHCEERWPTSKRKLGYNCRLLFVYVQLFRGYLLRIQARFESIFKFSKIRNFKNLTQKLKIQKNFTVDYIWCNVIYRISGNLCVANFLRNDSSRRFSEKKFANCLVHDRPHPHCEISQKKILRFAGIREIRKNLATRKFPDIRYFCDCLFQCPSVFVRRPPCPRPWAVCRFRGT